MLGRWITVEQRQGTPTRFYQNRAGNAPFSVPVWARHGLNRIPESFRVAARADPRKSGRWLWTAAVLERGSKALQVVIQALQRRIGATSREAAG